MSTNQQSQSAALAAHDSSSAAGQAPAPVPKRVRVVQLLFVTVAVIATMVLAYWQLSRWNTTNSFQNLGYALQWPAFGVFFIWAYRKYIAYERERREGNDEAAVATPSDQMTEIPEEFLPTNPDGSRKQPRPGAQESSQES